LSEKSIYYNHPEDIFILDQSETEHFPRLLNGDIHLWTLSLDASKDQIERLRSVLSPVEKKKASYYKFEHTQHNYIVSHGTLRILLSAYLQIRPEDIMMGVHKKGKPFLLNDVSLFFNISDSHGVCVFAFSRDGEVGIDIEKIRDLPDIDQLIEKNLTSGEKKHFQKDPDKKLSRFFEFWTLKESYLKAIGEGMRLTPDNLEFSLDGGNIKLQNASIGFDAADWEFKGIAPEENYTGGLTYKGKDTLIKEIRIAFRA